MNRSVMVHRLAAAVLALAVVASGCSHEKGGQAMFPTTPPPQTKENTLVFAAPAPPPPAPNGDQYGPVRAGGDVKAPTIATRVEPRATVEKGAAFLDVTVDRNGKVTDVAVVRAPSPAAGQAWSDAVRQWTFTPGTIDGRPVDVIYTLTVGMP